MNFSSMLKRFRAADVLIAIRAKVAEQYTPAPRKPMFDPWFADDPTYASAWAGAPQVVPA